MRVLIGMVLLSVVPLYWRKMTIERNTRRAEREQEVSAYEQALRAGDYEGAHEAMSRLNNHL
jgi:hypothetical protein